MLFNPNFCKQAFKLRLMWLSSRAFPFIKLKVDLRKMIFEDDITTCLLSKRFYFSKEGKIKHHKKVDAAPGKRVGYTVVVVILICSRHIWFWEGPPFTYLLLYTLTQASVCIWMWPWSSCWHSEDPSPGWGRKGSTGCSLLIGMSTSTRSSAGQSASLVWFTLWLTSSIMVRSSGQSSPNARWYHLALGCMLLHFLSSFVATTGAVKGDFLCLYSQTALDSPLLVA